MYRTAFTMMILASGSGYFGVIRDSPYRRRATWLFIIGLLIFGLPVKRHMTQLEEISTEFCKGVYFQNGSIDMKTAVNIILYLIWYSRLPCNPWLTYPILP